MAAFDEKEYTQDFDWSIWKRIFPIMGRYKGFLAGMTASSALSCAADVLYPLFQRHAIAGFIEAGALDGLGPFALAYAAVILVQSLLVVAGTRCAMNTEMYMGRDLRQGLFDHLQTLSLSFYNVTPVGYLLTRIANDTNRIAGNLAWGLFDLTDAVFYVSGSFLAMLALNWQLGLVVILIVPIMAALTGYFQPRILHWTRKVRRLNSKITGAFNEGITGAKTTKTCLLYTSPSPRD